MLFMWLNLIFRSLEHCHPTTKTDFVLFFSFHIKSHTEVPDNWFLTKSVFKSIILWLSCFSVFRRYSLRDNFDCHIVFTDSVHGFRIYHWKVPFRTIIAKFQSNFDRPPARNIPCKGDSDSRVFPFSAGNNGNCRIQSYTYSKRNFGKHSWRYLSLVQLMQL